MPAKGRWTRTSPRLPRIAGGFTTAYGVNDCGQVVGVTTTEAGGDLATLWDRPCAREAAVP